MSVLVTYSPPPPEFKDNLEIWSDEFLSPMEFYRNFVKIVTAEKNLKKYTKYSAVISYGKQGGHPHIHMLVDTPIRPDNVRTMLYKMCAVDPSKNHILIQCAKARDPPNCLPGRRYLYRNYLEPGGEIVRDDHELTKSFKHGDQASFFHNINRSEILSYMMNYIEVLPDRKEFNKTHFFSMIKELIDSGADLTHHMQHIDKIYAQLQIYCQDYVDPDLQIKLLKEISSKF